MEAGLLMAKRFLHEMITPAVVRAEQQYYDRAYPAQNVAPPRDPLTLDEAEFIQSRDSFYMATVTENDWPYLQHRGGPSGFLRVISPTQIGFADYGGNRQMLTTGNLSANDRVTLFLMDYPHRERLKIMGHAKVLDAREHPDLVEKLTPVGGHPAKPERIFLIEVISFDWNCPKFITPRYTTEEVQAVVEPLQKRIAELEAQLQAKK